MSALNELFSEPYVADGIFGDGVLQWPADGDQPDYAVAEPAPVGNVMALAINSSEVAK